MKESPKIKRIEDLADLVSDLRSEKKIVLCHGVFDLLHIGHIRHFEQAKNAGDILLVTVTPDIYVNKGPNRPAFPQNLRAESIAALDVVDYVAINNWPTAVETIKLLKPHIYAKGSEYKDKTKDFTGKIVHEEEAIHAVGGTILYTEDIIFSSSTLINKHLSVYSEEVSEYLGSFSAQYSPDTVIDYLKNAYKLKVLVIGEAIIDEYIYTEPIGMTTKDPLVAMRYLSSEKFNGGILAVANHVSNFCEHVGMLAMIGETQTQLDFIQNHLNPNIDQIFFSKKNSPTIVKRRHIDAYSMQKLFEVHEINDEELDSFQTTQLCGILEKIIPNYDLVIVVDFGHGMLTKEAIKILCTKTKFLVVNAQTNAENRGFNVISKYPAADYICLNMAELFLEERSRTKDVRTMIQNVSNKLNCGKIIVTRGKLGSICYDENVGFFEIPALATKVIDRMGSGDAMISITSLCMVQNAPLDIVGFIGNAVAAQAVATVGHKSSIEPAPLFKFITSLMK